jgi:hypothetical protein
MFLWGRQTPRSSKTVTRPSAAESGLRKPEVTVYAEPFHFLHSQTIARLFARR